MGRYLKEDGVGVGMLAEDTGDEVRVVTLALGTVGAPSTTTRGPTQEGGQQNENSGVRLVPVSRVSTGTHRSNPCPRPDRRKGRGVTGGSDRGPSAQTSLTSDRPVAGSGRRRTEGVGGRGL